MTQLRQSVVLNHVRLARVLFLCRGNQAIANLQLHFLIDRILLLIQLERNWRDEFPPFVHRLDAIGNLTLLIFALFGHI